MRVLTDFLWGGLREGLLMLWMTLWPLVLGFTISGIVQAFIPKDGLRRSLGETSTRNTIRASLLGVISSSCSYAASAMARAVFARGSSFTNATIFMVASTNLVIELGIVLWLLLGWEFLLAQLIGGAIMIGFIAVLGRRALDRQQEQVRAAVADAVPEMGAPTSEHKWRSLDNWYRASRYCIADLTMLRKELLFGFLVAGFLAAEVPDTFWSHLFMTGHGNWTVIENALIAPLLAVVSFVCSVGNIPLAAALWMKGVSFGGVVAFIFADLVTLPLLLIYRRFYGARVMWRMFLVLWCAMSIGGLIIDIVFQWWGLQPHRMHHVMTGHSFDLGWTLWLNVVAIVVLAITFVLGRRTASDDSVAIDPVCGMQVDTASPAAVADVEGQRYYFCAPRCQERFVDNPQKFLGATPDMVEDPDGDAIDPICGMRVNSKSPAAVAEGTNGPVYFCSVGCHGRYLAGPDAPPGTQQISLGRKPRD